MSKKLMIFLVFIVSAASIILVASFGTLPENSNLPSLDSLTITNQIDLIDENGEKVIYITEEMIINMDHTFVLNYVISPENAKNRIKATSSDSGVRVLVDLSALCVFVYFDKNTIKTVTVNIYDVGTEISDSVTLLLRRPGQVEV